MQPNNISIDDLDRSTNESLIDFENAMMNLTDKVRESKYKTQELTHQVSSAAQLIVGALLVSGVLITFVKLIKSMKASNGNT